MVRLFRLHDFSVMPQYKGIWQQNVNSKEFSLEIKKKKNSLVRAREGAVHEHKHVLSGSSSFPGQVAGGDSAATLDWDSQGQMPPIVSRSTALISAAKCSQGLEDPHEDCRLLLIICWVVFPVAEWKEGCREAEGGRRLSSSIHSGHSLLLTRNANALGLGEMQILCWFPYLHCSALCSCSKLIWELTFTFTYIFASLITSQSLGKSGPPR